MLLIRVEVCPEGDVDRAYTIGVGVVGRVADPDADGRATYVVALTKDGEQIGEGTVAHDPDAGMWQLIADATATALTAGSELPPGHVGQLYAAVARTIARDQETPDAG